jgi:hypothetical protein
MTVRALIVDDRADECCNIAESMIEEIERIWQEEPGHEVSEPPRGTIRRKLLRRIRSVADIAI